MSGVSKSWDGGQKSFWKHVFKILGILGLEDLFSQKWNRIWKFTDTMNMTLFSWYTPFLEGSKTLPFQIPRYFILSVKAGTVPGTDGSHQWLDLRQRHRNDGRRTTDQFQNWSIKTCSVTGGNGEHDQISQSRPSIAPTTFIQPSSNQVNSHRNNFSTVSQGLSWNWTSSEVWFFSSGEDFQEWLRMIKKPGSVTHRVLEDVFYPTTSSDAAGERNLQCFIKK